VLAGAEPLNEEGVGRLLHGSSRGAYFLLSSYPFN